jgi:undecaprenyl-diphosphatase
MSDPARRPGRWRLPAVPIPSGLDRLDVAVDDWFEAHLRGRPLVDRLMYTASAVGDHGLIWLALAVLQAARRPAQPQRRLLRVAGGLGIESALVNGPVKWLFRRTRPVYEGPRPLHLRRPLTSSFPSGHASSAFYGAAVLGDGDPWRPLYYAIAVVVASSRIHVKIHHASDVLVGSAIGAALGALACRLLPVQAKAESTPRSRGLHKP